VITLVVDQIMEGPWWRTTANVRWRSVLRSVTEALAKAKPFNIDTPRQFVAPTYAPVIAEQY